MMGKALLILGGILALSGCGKQSAVEGKITDARGQPLAEFKIIAEQTQPVAGYERFETRTGPDGVFRFDKLHPSAEYTLTPASERWYTEERRIKVDSAADGQTKTLTEAIAFRYMQSAEGTITDTKGQMEWYVGTAEARSWDNASSWVKGLTVAGGGWRMPASEELKTIQSGEEKKLAYDPIFKIDNCVWPSDPKSSKVWVAHGGGYGPRYYGPRYYGPGYYAPRYYGPGYYGTTGGHWETRGQNGKCRAIAVRSAKL